MSLDWVAIESAEQDKDFKDYAPNGEYKAKLESIKIVDNDNWKSPAIDIAWQEDEKYKYPKQKRHWLYISNQNFRVRHVRDMLVEFGISDTQAKQAIEKAEEDTDRAKLVKAYQAIFDRAVSRHPEVEIVVQTQMRDGQPVTSKKGTAYGEAEFKNPRLVIRDRENSSKVVSPDALDNEEITTDEIPF